MCVSLHTCERQWTEPRVHVCATDWATVRMHVTPHKPAIIADLTASQCVLPEPQSNA